MAVISLPNNLGIAEFAWGVIDYELEESSDATGASASRIIGPPRWTAHMVSKENMELDQAGLWEYIILSLRGDNVLALHDIVRVAPQGTMRGNPTLAAGLSIGDTSATFNSASGTLKRGDLLQFGTGFGTSQLVKVSADMTFPGTVNFQNPIRKAISSGSAVIWDKPVAYFRKVSRQSTLGTYRLDGLGQGDFSLDLVERFG